VRARWFSLLFASLLMLSCIGLSTAAASEPNITAAICDVYNIFNSLVPIGAGLAIFAAAVVYAIGQMLGAEVRARATVWAHALFFGGIFGIIIAKVIPWLLNVMTGEDVSTAC